MGRLVGFVTRVMGFCQLVTHLVLASPFAQGAPLHSDAEKNISGKSSGSGETSTGSNQNGSTPSSSKAEDGVREGPFLGTDN